MRKCSIRSAALFMVTGWGFTASVTAQSGMDQVQAVVIGLHTTQQAHHADELILALDGVLVSRTDVNTSNLFLLVRPASTLTEAEVEQQLASSGLTLRCWTRTPRTNAPFRHLDPNACEQPVDTR